VNSLTDQQLLRDYTERRSETAFAELVRRHVDFVYSAALRMVRDAHLAEDVTQGVFVALARNVRQLTNHPVLAGWLHRTTQNLAANTVRSNVRRRAREQEAAAMNELLATEPNAIWEHIAPHLDAALSELSDADHDALLLRYFQCKSASEIAHTLGISEDAAQKRVSRAVERLREFFAKRGVTVGAGGLVVTISASAVQAAPAGLAATISSAAVLAGTTIATTTTATITKAIAMTTLQKTLITATLTAAIGTGIYEAHQAAQLREQNQTLQQQQAPFVEQIQQLQRERDDATNRLAGLQDEIAETKSNNLELLKLRAQTRLNGTSDDLAKLQNENDDLKMEISSLKGRWFNVTYSPQFSMPYLKRDQWGGVQANGDPMGIFFSAAAAARDGDEAKLAELISGEDDQAVSSLFSKQRWDDVKGIQMVSTDTFNRNGQVTATVSTIIIKKINAPSESGRPPALEDLITSHPEMHRWYFSKTETGWKITGGD
jgi:RNA polymerase sigma factor (sigma-70 family)